MTRSTWIGLLACGLLLRLLILSQTTTLGTPIVDEQHYTQIAGNILAGNGFAWGPGNPTSIRPPLYPGLLAGLWRIFGDHNLVAVRIAQTLLAMATAWVVGRLGTLVFGERAGRMATLIYWLYPSLIFFDFLMLTETLFTFLLLMFLLLTTILIERPRPLVALACGATLALTALTRSVLWPLPALLCPLLVLLLRGPIRQRLAIPLLVLVGYVVVISPWAIRNTRLQGVTTIVDTMGGINLRMGNYEYTLDDRMWDTVALTGTKNWASALAADLPGQPVTEGQKDKWAQRKAIQYMLTHPSTTLHRSLIKFADFWGLERELIAGIQQGLFTPPRWFGVLASLAIVICYVVVVCTGAVGFWLAAPRDWRLHVLLLLPVLVTMGAHTIVFGHSRYHLPLMPIFGLYSAALVVRLSSAPRWRMTPRLAGAALSVAVLAAIWIRQLVVVDSDRIVRLLQAIL